MAHADFSLNLGLPQVVGSFGSINDLVNSDVHAVQRACDIVEIRLDLLASETGSVDSSMWGHMGKIPLLFTARRSEEGGARRLNAMERTGLLRSALAQATLIDIEVASISEMVDLLQTVGIHGIPWIASFHDFDKLPETSALETAAKRAKDAGAAVFKAAAKLNSPADLARLAEFQLADHGLPVSTMGMGSLAAVSRLLCAQCGSVLNYGYLGNEPTAPGQWDAASLKQAIARLAMFKI